MKPVANSRRIVARYLSAVSAQYEQALKNTRAGEGTLRQAAELCIFLASPAADYITGQTISIDGGISMI